MGENVSDKATEVSSLKVDKQREWVKRNNVKRTPTIFIDGYELPDIYDLKDIKYLVFND